MFFFKQKTAYEVRISDWSSDVYSSVLTGNRVVIATKGPLPDPGAVRRNAKAMKATLAPFGIQAEQILQQIGRASCRERVCQYAQISVVAGSLKKQNIINTT